MSLEILTIRLWVKAIERIGYKKHQVQDTLKSKLQRDDIEVVSIEAAGYNSESKRFLVNVKYIIT